MLLDWIAREGGIVLSWWALVSAAGLAALPLGWRLLGGLPDRGYTLARAVGVLLVAFTFWLLASLGFLINTTGSMALAWAIVAGVGLAIWLLTPAHERFDLRGWWRENRPVVIAGEILFFVLLFGWAIVRAHQNGLVATEKPMELAFISATMRSETFPPNDPWLSGYAISYYYFGYVMAAMLSMLSGVPSSVGFNMMISLLFALTGLTAFGVVYNLVRGGAFASAISRISPREEPIRATRRAGIIVGLLGMVFVVLLGSFQFPLIEIPYQTRIASEAYLDFWGSNERMQVRQFGSTEPVAWDYWWWFRAARTLNDVYPDGGREEVIDEFPQFSFLLADVHPHVLALPFAALALGLALNALLRGRDPRGGEIVFYALIVGGLIFLNTWDGPIYGIILIAALALGRLMHGGGWLRAGDYGRLIGQAIALFGLAALFYLPFLIGFRSQLAGVLPNLLFPTLFQQFFAHFGPLLIIVVFFVAIEAARGGWRTNFRLGAQIALTLLVLLVFAMLVLVIVGWLIPELRGTVLSYVERLGGWSSVLPQVLTRRVTHSLTSLLLALIVLLAAARLFAARPRETGAQDDAPPYAPATAFALLLIAAGAVLTLVPEFVYLRDYFGHRMNTVFKFYYQTWLLWSVAGAYAVYAILANVHVHVDEKPIREGVVTTFSVILSIAVTLGLLYPVFGLHNRMFVETGRWNGSTTRPLTLDGASGFTHPGDVAAALCLADVIAASGQRGDDLVVAEAVGGSYRGEYGRTATLTGIPVVYNWPFHQQQWRGPTLTAAAGTREQDLDLLYADPSWETARAIIARYSIDYIAFGTPEAGRYGASAAQKFSDRLETVCANDTARYFRVPETLQTAASR
jgi:YYY domain-containing protein